METLLKETALLNYGAPQIQALIQSRDWRGLNEKQRISAIYAFVRDEVAFGYSASDGIRATDVLDDGYGQCNTKGTLLMALLRAVGIPCRMHGFYIDKAIQKGTIKGFYYRQSPKEILHSWVEVLYNGKWLNFEGFILDRKYLRKLQRKFLGNTGFFSGFGVATQDFANPPVEWDGNDTYIQKEGITKDLGIFDDPDELFETFRQKLGRVQGFAYKYLVRHLMNRNVQKIRLIE